MMNNEIKLNKSEYSKLQNKMFNVYNDKFNFFVDYKTKMVDENYILTYSTDGLTRALDILSVKNDKNDKKEKIKKVIYILNKLKLVIDSLNMSMLNVNNIAFDFDKIYFDSSNSIYFTYIPKSIIDDKFVINDEIIGALQKEKLISDKDVSKIQSNISSTKPNIKMIIYYLLGKRSSIPQNIYIFITFILLITLVLVIILCKSKVFLIIDLAIILILNLIILTKKFSSKENENENTILIKKRAGLKESIFGIKHYINKNEFLIGSGSQCDLKIKDNTVSSKHVMIYNKFDEWYIKDLNSKNKTYLNGNAVNNLQKLNSGDIVKISRKMYLFFINK